MLFRGFFRGVIFFGDTVYFILYFFTVNYSILCLLFTHGFLKNKGSVDKYRISMTTLDLHIGDFLFLVFLQGYVHAIVYCALPLLDMSLVIPQ